MFPSQLLVVTANVSTTGSTNWTLESAVVVLPNVTSRTSDLATATSGTLTTSGRPSAGPGRATTSSLRAESSPLAPVSSSSLIYNPTNVNTSTPDTTSTTRSSPPASSSTPSTPQNPIGTITPTTEQSTTVTSTTPSTPISPTSSPTTSHPPSSSVSVSPTQGRNTHSAAITGGIVGGLVAVLCCLLLFLFLIRLRRKRIEHAQNEIDTSLAPFAFTTYNNSSGIQTPSHGSDHTQNDHVSSSEWFHPATPPHRYPTTPALSLTTQISADTQWAAAELLVQHEEVLMTENSEEIDSEQRREENEPVGVAL